jgi:flagellar hook-associated protein 2
VARGKIVITDSGSRSATIDLSRATSVNDVLEAINSNGSAQVTASVSGGKFVIKDNGGGSVAVANGQGSTMATSLGLAGVASSGGKVTGSTVYRMSGATTLASLNDGNGVSVKTSTTEASYNFQLRVANGSTTTTVNVNLSDVYADVSGTPTKTAGAVSDLAGAVTRINSALTAAGFSNIAASIDNENNRLQIVDSTSTRTLSIVEGSDTTAADLGLSSSVTGSALFGRRLMAGMQTTMASGASASRADMMRLNALPPTTASSSCAHKSNQKSLSELLLTKSRVSSSHGAEHCSPGASCCDNGVYASACA